jgi:hypothetical protein
MVADTNMNQLKTARKFIMVSLATLIRKYQPRVALHPLSKENGVS